MGPFKKLSKLGPKSWSRRNLTRWIFGDFTLSASRYVSSISNPVWSSQEVLKSIIVNNGFTTNQSMFFDIFWVVSEMMVFLHVPKWRKKVTNDPLGLTSGSVTQKIGELNCNAF